MKAIKLMSSFILSTTLALGISTSASAAVMSLSNGLYGEANVGYGNVTTTANRNNGFAGSVMLGYKFNEYFAIDGGYTILPKGHVSTHYPSLALKGIWPLGNGDWDFFAKGGVAAVRGQKNSTLAADTNAAFYYGAGFTYWFQQDFGLVIQGTGTMATTNNIPQTYTITTGLTYFF